MPVEETEESAEPCGPTYYGVSEKTPLLSHSEHTTMPERNIGISQQTLVSANGDQLGKAKRLPQYLAGLAATLGALAAGMVLGWSSPAGQDGIDLSKNYNIAITPDQFSWIGALAPLGAAFVCIPIGVLTDIIGRKASMLILVVPFTAGWLLVIFANSVIMFYFGRFILGFSGGAFCVTAPMYTAEISESAIRGTLGSYFQLLLTVGILLTYVLGSVLNMFVLSIISAIMPLVFFAVFIFMPETPTYFLKKGNMEAARVSMLRLRGSQYDVDTELRMQQEAIEATTRNNVSFLQAMKSKAAKRELIIAYGLMFFQQFCGVNAVIFYSQNIFNAAHSSVAPAESAIIIGVMQVVSVFISTLVIDRLGRRILLMASIITLCITTLLLGVYFYLKDNSPESITNITWLPLASLCVFIILFSLGFGPIPWLMMAEIFAPEIKGVAASSACVFNWLLAFVVTKCYKDLTISIETFGTFFLFSGICAVGLVFIYFLVPETKGKSLEMIQRELSA